MKRCFPVLMFIALILLILPGQALAAGAEWKMVMNSDRTLNETVQVQTPIILNSPGWTTGGSSNAPVFNRQVASWSAYNQLVDRLPIEILVKDYILWQSITIQTAPQYKPNGLYESLQNQPLKVVVQAPAIGKVQQGQKQNERTAVWEFAPGSLQNQGILMHTYLIDGFMSSIALFVLSFIVIGFIFIRKVGKTHRLIEEEYSLENLDEQKEKPEEK